ncbi:hypothetical protein PTTG_03725, partial [Puccinia triticina 1-1 BBBD Race 1]
MGTPNYHSGNFMHFSMICLLLNLAIWPAGCPLVPGPVEAPNVSCHAKVNRDPLNGHLIEDKPCQVDAAIISSFLDVLDDDKLEPGEASPRRISNALVEKPQSPSKAPNNWANQNWETPKNLNLDEKPKKLVPSVTHLISNPLRRSHPRMSGVTSQLKAAPLEILPSAQAAPETSPAVRATPEVSPAPAPPAQLAARVPPPARAVPAMSSVPPQAQGTTGVTGATSRARCITKVTRLPPPAREPPPLPTLMAKVPPPAQKAPQPPVKPMQVFQNQN